MLLIPPTSTIANPSARCTVQLSLLAHKRVIRSSAWCCQQCHRRFHTERNLHQHQSLNRHFDPSTVPVERNVLRL